MNRYGEIEPGQIAKLWEKTTVRQYRAVIAAAELIRGSNEPALDDYLWGITAAAYRAGRLSMWRDIRKARQRANTM